MKSEDLKFVIVDYGAKYQFTHHLPIIEAYCNIIKSRGFDVDIYLTKHANRIAFDSLPGNKKYFLTGTVYTPSYKENFILASLISLFNYFLKNKQGDNSFKKFLKICFSHRAKKALLKECKNNTRRIVVVFPTAEPVGIQLVRSLLSDSKGGIFIFKFRMVGGESRGFLSSENELEELVKLVNIFPNKIQVGIETSSYKNYLLSKGFSSQNLEWSPWPPIIKSDVKKIKARNSVVLGFLGNAKARKGFSHIPDILRRYEKINPHFTAIIQPAIFPWDGYFDILKELSPLSSKIIYTDRDLNLQQLLQLVANTNVLILPYDSTSYSINASGLLYHASDYNVPVITLKGVGFEAEVLEYNLGFVANSLQEMVQQLNSLNHADFDFKSYRDARLKATQRFIFNVNK